jgi:hypothetical protein
MAVEVFLQFLATKDMPVFSRLAEAALNIHFYPETVPLPANHYELD